MLRPMSIQLTLVVPDMLNGVTPVHAQEAVAGGQAGVEALEWLLTLAERRPHPGSEYAGWIWQQAGQREPVPVAELSYRYDFGVSPPGPVLRADPVCLEADRDCVRLSAAPLPMLEPAESRQLVDEINEQFIDEPWSLVSANTERWYLLLEEDAGLRTCNPERVRGRDIHDFMPTGERHPYWRKIINEIQMLMFNSPVNHRRRSQAALMANSLWLWGEGEMPPTLSLPWVALYTSDPVVAGMGLRAGLPVAPCPSTAQELLDILPTEGCFLCQPAFPAAQQWLVAFNHDWGLPIYKALQRRLLGSHPSQQLATVELLTANGVSYHLTAGKRRWWRRRRRIDTFQQ